MFYQKPHGHVAQAIEESISLFIESEGWLDRLQQSIQKLTDEQFTLLR